MAAIILATAFRHTSRLVGASLGSSSAEAREPDRPGAPRAGHAGRVVDFIDPHVWPVFNLADTAIVVGAIVLALVGLRERRGARTDPGRTVKRTVEAEEGRLDAVVARITGAARADVQRAIAAGTVRVDGAPRPKSFRLHGGERLTIEIDPDAPLTAEGPPVPIRYEDDQLAVVAKPAGLVTHPTAARRSGTLVNRLLGMGVPLAPAGGALRPGIVHRFDAGTSGLLVVAKTDEAYTALRRLFHDHTVERGYVALVRGASGTTPSPSTRRSDGGRRRSWWTRPKDARRRHGSRCGALRRRHPRGRASHGAHASDPGPPGGDRPSDLGDRAYGGGGDDARSLGLDRPFLHAGHLSFAHPITHRTVTLDEGLPEDLRSALHRLRERLA